MQYISLLMKLADYNCNIYLVHHTVYSVISWVLFNIMYFNVLYLGGCTRVCMCLLGDGSCSFVHTSSGEGMGALYAVSNPRLPNKICLNQQK